MDKENRPVLIAEQAGMQWQQSIPSQKEMIVMGEPKLKNSWKKKRKTRRKGRF